MKCLILALAVWGVTATGVYAQDTIPDLKGTWSGKGKVIVFGNNPHHPGAQTTADAPRVHDRGYPYRGRPGWPGRLGSLFIRSRRYQRAICLGCCER